MSPLRIVAAGDAALLIELPPRIDPETSSRVIAIGEAIRARHGSALRDVVVGYCTVTVYFDPRATDADRLAADITSLARDVPVRAASAGRTIEVPVCYGGELGPDLGDVASLAGCTEQEAIALHVGPTYRVYVVGFVPGFPYMAPVDPRLVLPRRAVPRTRVPAGSVAIAAGQTGIYPSETPGGWHVIGRTWLKPYDAGRAEPVLFRPGDDVRFRQVTRDAFDGAMACRD